MFCSTCAVIVIAPEKIGTSVALHWIVVNNNVTEIVPGYGPLVRSAQLQQSGGTTAGANSAGGEITLYCKGADSRLLGLLADPGGGGAG